jgi:hypothetical protein
MAFSVAHQSRRRSGHATSFRVLHPHLEATAALRQNRLIERERQIGRTVPMVASEMNVNMKVNMNQPKPQPSLAAPSARVDSGKPWEWEFPGIA